MSRQRRAVERIVTSEVMRLERRLAIERGDIADARRRPAVPPPTATACAVLLRARAQAEWIEPRVPWPVLTVREVSLRRPLATTIVTTRPPAGRT